METFRQQLAATGVTDPRHILNADETGLLYKNMPTYTYVRSIEAKTVRGSKNMEAKDRITLQLMATADGHKGPILVIGKQKSPRCFTGNSLPSGVYYTSQTSAWMDKPTCQYWVDHVLTPWKRQLLNFDKVW